MVEMPRYGCSWCSRQIGVSSVQRRLVVVENEDTSSKEPAILERGADAQERDRCERKLRTKVSSRRRLLRGL